MNTCLCNDTNYFIITNMVQSHFWRNGYKQSCLSHAFYWVTRPKEATLLYIFSHHFKTVNYLIIFAYEYQMNITNIVLHKQSQVLVCMCGYLPHFVPHDFSKPRSPTEMFNFATQYQMFIGPTSIWSRQILLVSFACVSILASLGKIYRDSWHFVFTVFRCSR